MALVDAKLIEVVEAHRAQVDQLVGMAERQPVENERTAKMAVAVIERCSKRRKTLDEARTAAVKPLNDQVKEINGRFQPEIKRLKAAEDTLKGRVLAYQREVRRRAEEAARKAREEQMRQEAEARKNARPAPPPPPPPDPAAATKAALSGLKTRKTWTFQVEDLSQVPVGYLQLNETAVRQAIREGAREIPGLRIFEDETVTR